MTLHLQRANDLLILEYVTEGTEKYPRKQEIKATLRLPLKNISGIEIAKLMLDFVMEVLNGKG